ncbi:hypothetical protein ACFYOK_33145 [Microbispora bryophytorum]|uniref:hypothetical protein n=1 Tax=Microbispora bryophytorum TaxID=1460882 RepID=UPI0033C063AE
MSSPKRSAWAWTCWTRSGWPKSSPSTREGTGRAEDRAVALGLGAQTFLDLDADDLHHAGEVDVVFDVLGGDILGRSAELARHHRRTPGKTIIQVTDEQGAQHS